MMRKRILSVLPIYFPDNAISVNIKSFIENIDLLIIINNSSTDLTSLLIDLPSEKLYIYSPGLNIGLSKAYNYGINFAIQYDYQLMLIMDQDSSFINSNFWKYLKRIENDKKIAMVSAATSNDKSDFISNFNEFFYQRKILMSSGTVIFIENITKVGLFDEYLFIDEVDHDFSLRCHHNGLLNLTTYDVYMKHSVGEFYNNKFPFNLLKDRIIIHKPFRYY